MFETNGLNNFLIKPLQFLIPLITKFTIVRITLQVLNDMSFVMDEVIQNQNKSEKKY